MNLDQFLREVLPAAGTYFTVQITATGTTRQYHHTSIEEAVASIQAIKARHHNAYFATGSFLNHNNRKQGNCKSKRAWYVDIDCKEGGQYPTKKEAVKAIQAAIKQGLPEPTILVDSGNGLHPYWACLEEVSRTDWEAYAKALQAACVRTGLKVDVVVTEDAARILRAPNSLNYKDPSHPKPCKILTSSGHHYTFQEFADAMNPFLTGPATVPIDNSDLYAGLPEGKEAKAVDMIASCPLFAKTAKEHGEHDAEPLWHKIIHTLAYCEDGKDYIHPLSDGHLGYNKRKTERKFAFSMQKKASGEGGPTLCDTFNKLSPICKSCEHRNKIKSPIKLGFGLPPELPWPYRNNDTEKQLEKATDDGWEKAVRYTVKDFVMHRLPDKGFSVSVKIGDEQVDTTLTEFAADARACAKVLTDKGISLGQFEIRELLELVSAWVHQLRQNKQVSQGVNCYGWIDKQNTQFHFAGKIFSKSGVVPIQTTDKALDKVFTPTGTLGPWQACANHILSQPREASWAVIASSFAAPLLKFTGITGSLLSIVSQDSGTGKSTAMRIAQGVWGNPKSGMASLDDTHNSVAHRLGALNNLPAYWDEVRERDQVQKFILHVFRLAQGREKSRLNSSIQQRHTGEWGTMLTIATNERLRDHIEQHVGNSDAGMARVFEILAEPIGDDGMSDGAANTFFKKLENNYGHAGLQYAEYIGTNAAAVELMVERLNDTLTGALKTTKPERFWISTIVALIAGATLANKIGVCQFDVIGLRNYLIREFKRMRVAKADSWRSPTERAVDLVADFLHDKHQYTCRMDRMPGKGRPGAMRLAPTRSPAVVRVGEDDKIVRVLDRAFKDWYYERFGAGYTDVTSNLRNAGAVYVSRGSIDAGIMLKVHLELV